MRKILEDLPENLFSIDDLEPERCTGVNCENEATYRHQGTNLPLCSTCVSLYKMGEMLRSETKHHRILFGTEAKFKKIG